MDTNQEMTILKEKHITPSESREDFQPGKMKLNSYSMESIRDALIDHLNRFEEELTKTQKDTMERFKYQGTWNLSHQINLEDLRNSFEIFDDIFFNGILKSYYTLGIYRGDHCGDEAAYRNYTHRGCSGRDPRFKQEHEKVALMFRETDSAAWPSCEQV